MKEFKLIGAGLLVLLICFYGCKPDTDIFIPDEVDVAFVGGDIGDFFAAVRPASDVYTITPNRTRITTPSGTNIIFQNYDFETAGGNSIFENLQVEVNEVFGKTGMIYFDKPTISSTGRLLVSAGEIFIDLSYNGEEIKLGPENGINIQVPNSDYRGEMELFYGEESQAGFVWVEADNDPNSSESVWGSEWLIDSMNLEFGYECFSEEIGWINYDYFFGQVDDLTNVCVDLPDGFDSSNTAAYMVFNNLNSVIHLYGDPDAEMFCTTNMPVGEEITIVVVSVDDMGAYYFGNATSTINLDLQIEITPVQTELDDIKNFIGNL